MITSVFFYNTTCDNSYVFYGYELYCGYKLYHNLWQPKVAFVFDTNLWYMECFDELLSFRNLVLQQFKAEICTRIIFTFQAVGAVLGVSPGQWKVRFNQDLLHKNAIILMITATYCSKSFPTNHHLVCVTSLYIFRGMWCLNAKRHFDLQMAPSPCWSSPIWNI